MNQQHLRAIAALSAINDKRLAKAVRAGLEVGDLLPILAAGQAMQEIAAARAALYDKSLGNRAVLENLQARIRAVEAELESDRAEIAVLDAAVAQAEKKYDEECDVPFAVEEPPAVATPLEWESSHQEEIDIDGAIFVEEPDEDPPLCEPVEEPEAVGASLAGGLGNE